MRDTPIVIIAFNRPGYLEPVLRSLLAQTALGTREVFLFQDNAVNPCSGMRYADDETIAKSIDTFRRLIPNGIVFTSPHNIGVLENYRRAEHFVFRELQSEAAYFFEDDLVLSPHYLAMLDQMCAFALRSDAIGHFACYGQYLASLDLQHAHATEVTRLKYHWGFGLTRRHWTALNEWLQPYYERMQCDYRQRPDEEIRAYYVERGYPLKWSGQDYVKKVGTCALGRLSLNTFACFGKNIGVFGLHTNPRFHRDQGFGNAVPYPHAVELNFPDAQELARLHAEEVAAQRERIA